MALTPPTERDVDHRIDALKRSPGTFQRLVEAFVKQEFHDTGARLIPIGRTSADVTIKGWPDAETRLPDGRIHAFEATHSDAWAVHVKKDAEKLQTLAGRVESYLLVAWSKTPSREDELEYRNIVAGTGVPAENVRFIFRKELVNLLTAPRHARIWAEHLNLPVAAEPFALIRSVHTLYGTKAHRDSFMPTREEFETPDAVHCPAVANTVLQELQERRWSVVYGKGASGKTVLATAIALGPAYAARTVYYLDLSGTIDDDNRARAIDFIATRGENGVLFIVDNVHRDRVCASKLFEYWRSSDDGSHLLMIGRLTSFVPERGEGDPLAEISESALVLAPEEADLAGVYRRIARRITERPRVPEPEPAVLAEWARMFSGDLLAFSAAVSSRAHAVVQRHQWQLTPRDAEDYLARTYLDGKPREEIVVLERLSALAQIELQAPAKAFRHRVPERTLSQGLVLRTEHGRERQIRFRLVHPGMGDLLLGVLRDTNPLQVLHDIATDDPLIGVLIASRLHNTGRHDDARFVLGAFGLVGAPYSPAFSPMVLPTTVHLLVSLGLLPASQVPGYLNHFVDDLLRDAVQTRRGYLNRFLAFARKNVTGFLPAFGTALTVESTRRELIHSLLDSLPGELARFLDWCQAEFPAAYRAILSDLARPDYRDSITACMLSSQLGEAVMFLEYIGKRDGQLAAILGEALLTPESLAAAANAAARTPPSIVAEYILRIHRLNRDVLPQLATAMLARGTVKHLLHRPGDLSRLLTVLHTHLPAVYASCAAVLRDPGRSILGNRSVTDNAALIETLRDLDEPLFADILRALTETGRGSLRTIAEATQLIDLLQAIDGTAAARVAGMLLDAGHAAELRRQLETSPLAEIAAFLRSIAAARPDAASPLPAGLQEVVLRKLDLLTGEEDVSQLLAVLHESYPELYLQSIATISSEPLFGRLIAATATGAHAFALSLLQFNDEHDKPFGSRITAAIVQPAVLAALAASLLRKPESGSRLALARARQFLEILQRADGNAAAQLADALLDRGNAAALIDAIARPPMTTVVEFLQSVANARSDAASLTTDAAAAIVAKFTTGASDENASPLLQTLADAFPDVYARCIETLRQPQTFATLIGAIKDGAFALAASILRFDRTKDTLSASIAAALTATELVPQLAASLGRAPLSSVIAFLEAIREWLPSEESRFDEALAQTGLVKSLLDERFTQTRMDLVRFIDAAEGIGPRMAAVTREACSEPSFVTAFADGAIHPAELVQLARYTQDRIPALHTAIVERIKRDELLDPRIEVPINDAIAFLRLMNDLGADETIGHALVERYGATLSRSPIDHATTFLRIIADQAPAVFATLQESLESDAVVEAFVDAARDWPPDHFVSFIRFAQVNFPRLAAAVIASLDVPGACSAMIAKAGRGALDGLTAFLTFAREHLPHAWEDIAESVAEDVRTWAAMAAQGPQASFAAFLQFAGRLDAEDPLVRRDVVGRLVESLDAKRWIRTHENDGYFFAIIGRTLSLAGRGDLVQPVAHAAIARPRLAVWKWGFHLPALTSAIRSGGPFTGTELDGFLRTVATPAWLLAQYRLATPGMLASTLFDLWCQLEPRVLRRFLIPPLSECFREVWHQGRHDSGAALLDRINLTGTLFLLRFTPLPRIRIANSILDDAARLVMANASDKNQLQFWCGIRYLATMEGRPPRLAVDIVRAAQEQLAAAVPGDYPRVNELTADLAAWLAKDLRKRR